MPAALNIIQCFHCLNYSQHFSVSMHIELRCICVVLFFGVPPAQHRRKQNKNAVIMLLFQRLCWFESNLSFGYAPMHQYCFAFARLLIAKQTNCAREQWPVSCMCVHLQLKVWHLVGSCRFQCNLHCVRTQCTRSSPILLFFFSFIACSFDDFIQY